MTELACVSDRIGHQTGSYTDIRKRILRFYTNWYKIVQDDEGVISGQTILKPEELDIEVGKLSKFESERTSSLSTPRLREAYYSSVYDVSEVFNVSGSVLRGFYTGDDARVTIDEDSYIVSSSSAPEVIARKPLLKPPPYSLSVSRI